MKKIFAGLTAFIALCTMGTAAAENRRSAEETPEQPACTYRITLPSAEQSSAFVQEIGRAIAEYGKAFAVSTEPSDDGNGIVLVIGE